MIMADKENQVCPSPGSIASRKRPNESGQGGQMVKKRAALGELTNNTSNPSDLSQKAIVGMNRKLKPENASKKTKGGVNLDFVISQGSDHTQKFEYAPSIYQHLLLLEVEATRRPLSCYMEKVQTDINPVMRSVLVDWLVEVAEEYNLVSDTLYLTVNYVDRYLSTHNLIRNKLQLLGVSCMLVASKHEEIAPPHVEDFCYITDNTYTKEEVLQMEKEVLKFLNFGMAVPTTKTFIRTFSQAAKCKPMFSDPKFELLCCYLAELSLPDYGCVCYIPSTIAASAIFLARLTIQPECHPWTLALQRQTGYKPNALKDCVLRLHKLQLQSESYARAVRQKYMDPKFKSVASFDPPSEISACFFDVPIE